MDFDSDIRRGREIGEQLSKLLEGSEQEILDKLLSFTILPDGFGSGALDRTQLAQLNLELNREKVQSLNQLIEENHGADVLADVRAVFNSFAGEYSELIKQDVERMGSHLVELGFPDVRADRNNWSIIARMVGGNPNGFYEEIYESALAFVALRAMPNSQGNSETPTQPPSDYVRLWDYANKNWSKGSDNFKICEVIANGPGNYTECVNALLPKVSRTEQTKRFHSVLGPLNKAIRAELGLEVYREGEQVLIRNATDTTQSKPKRKRPTTKAVKKSGTKRKP